MNIYPSTLDDLNYNSISLERAELRNGKIIIVIKPDLLLNQNFAVNPFYTEGKKKDRLKSTHFEIRVKEASGKVDAEVLFGNGLSHFTYGHRQIHYPMSCLFKTKIELAVFEVLKTDSKLLRDSDRMEKLINNLDTDEDRSHVRSIIKKRIRSLDFEDADTKKNAMLKAIKEYEESLSNLRCE